MSQNEKIGIMIILLIVAGVVGYFMMKKPLKPLPNDIIDPDIIDPINNTDIIDPIDVVTLAPIVKGCTDSTATNYDSKATKDDGTCAYAPVPTLKPFDKYLYDCSKRLSDPIPSNLRKAYEPIRAMKTWNQFITEIWINSKKTYSSPFSSYNQKTLWLKSEIVK